MMMSAHWRWKRKGARMIAVLLSFSCRSAVELAGSFQTKGCLPYNNSNVLHLQYSYNIYNL